MYPGRSPPRNDKDQPRPSGAFPATPRERRIRASRDKHCLPDPPRTPILRGLKPWVSPPGMTRTSHDKAVPSQPPRGPEGAGPAEMKLCLPGPPWTPFYTQKKNKNKNHCVSYTAPSQELLKNKKKMNLKLSFQKFILKFNVK